ncbi:probable ribonuclease 11 [Onychomys torridus]|uniref:probable ribonuclease 11 n=1 Tax=Onychomys torridus TaxID=38674 RepID=UPI00167FBCB5|nr:probable ribonuclease 11 [Onychomys torridus]
MTIFVLWLGLGVVLVAPSESTMKGIRENFSQEETQPAAKQTVGDSVTSTLSDKNISISKNGMSASQPTSRRLYFLIPKGNTLSNDQDCLNGPRVWREVLDTNESCQLGNNCRHGSPDGIHGAPKATRWKCSCESLGLEHTICKISAGQQCPRCQEHSVTSLKRILTVLTSHSLMSWLVSGSKL